MTWALDRDLMRLLGLYVAEGHSDARQVGFTFSSRETGLVEEIVATARALGLSTTVEPRPRNAVRVKVFGGLTSLLLPAWCGRGAKSKKVPGFVFHAGREMRQHFLDGLYLGDGHRVKTREVLMLTSASRAWSRTWRCSGCCRESCPPARGLSTSAVWAACRRRRGGSTSMASTSAPRTCTGGVTSRRLSPGAG